MALSDSLAKRTSVVLVAGGHSSGKRTVCDSLKKELLSRINKDLINNDNLIKIIDMDSYLKKNNQFPDSKITLFKDFKDFKDFRHSFNQRRVSSNSTDISNSTATISQVLSPDRFDFDALKQDILRDSQQKPNPVPVVLYLVHGLYALFDQDLRNMSDFNIFIDCDADTRLTRWINEDIIENKQNDIKLQDILEYYLNYARQEMNQFILPTKTFSDIILTKSSDPTSISILSDGISSILKKNLLSQFNNNDHGIGNEKVNSPSLFPYNKLSASSTKVIENYRQSSIANSQQGRFDLERENLNSQVQRYYDLN